MDIKMADVVLCEFYFSDLKTSKNRPVLVLKDNLPFNDFIGLPISSQLDVLRECEIAMDNAMFSDGGYLKNPNSCSESRLLFLKATLSNAMAQLTTPILKSVSSCFASILVV